MRPIGAALGVLVIVGAFVLYSAAYTLDQTQQAVILQFGAKPVGVVKEPGLHFKVPFIHEIARYDKRLLIWDGSPNQIPTAGREFIHVDTTARWKIVDPLRLRQAVTNEAGAQSRLDDIIDSVVRDEISSTELHEIVRSEGWKVEEEKIQRVQVDEETQPGLTEEVKKGRQALTRSILEEAQKNVAGLGVELVDVRIKRLNYVPSVRKQVFQRMISERQRIAERFRAEGQGRSQEIQGETQRDKQRIISAARRDAEKIRGQADAEAAKTYANAYGTNPEFYGFYRSLESYRNSVDEGTVLFVGSDSDYFRYLREITPAGKPR